MIILEIKKQIENYLRKFLPDLPGDFVFEINQPPQTDKGDFSINCFKLIKNCKKSASQIASELNLQLNDAITEENGFLIKSENIGPYLNFFINKGFFFSSVLGEILDKKNNFGQQEIGKGKSILIEYSAPNTNKPQHLGHLRNNFLGWSLATIFSTVGYKAIKVNLVNDRGIHICKSMLAYRKWGNGKTPETEKVKGDHFVGQYYVLFEKKVKENPELLDEAQKDLEGWENGNSEILFLWQLMNKWANDGFKKTYEKIGVSFDRWYYESDIYNSGRDIILKALKKGLCYKREDGAVEIDLTHDGLDKKVLLRPNTTSVYITQDIGLAKLKQDEFNPDKSIYVVASEQDYHFRVLFRILEIFGFDWVKNCRHLSYGMVFLPEGRMKSREGIVVDADDIIEEMIQLAKSEIIHRSPNLSPIEVSSRAKVIAIGALRFFFLKFTPQQEIYFNPKDSISFEGDSGPYLQYTYARIQSILKKDKPKKRKSKINYNALTELEEKELLNILLIYPNVIIEAAENYNPANLAHYLLKLSQKFNEFYHKHQILKAKAEIRNARLCLAQAVAQIIKNGLKLLGIDVLEEM